MDLIDVKGLLKRFGGITALGDARFNAAQSEVHALLGENGAGKSTFIQILAGTLTYDAGEIALAGKPYRPENPKAAEAEGIAAVFQELSLVPDLTVEQNIWFRREPRTWLGTVDRHMLRRQTENLLRRYGFPGLVPDRELRRLTLAEQQLTEIAKTLAKEPRILILDEATSALPTRETEWLLKLTRKLADEGRLVIFISHRMTEVRAIADRMTIFRNGQTVAVHDARNVSDDQIVTEMLGRQMKRLYPERVPTATQKMALKVRDLSSAKRLEGVNFDLYEGEVLGVGGLQGHGQREFFRALFGVAKSKGTVELWGRAVGLANPRQAIKGRDGIALVPEDRRDEGLLLSKTVRENLTLSVISRFASNGFLNRRKEAELVREMVDFLKIKISTSDQLVGTLSGGNQQKVLFGKMLLTQARVLLLYDPTRGVDVGTKGEIFQLMRDLAGQGYAILFYSSDLPELVNVADRVLVMREGRIAATLTGGRISEADILRAAVFDAEAA